MSYWAADPADVARTLQTGLGGLSSREAAARLEEYGPNSVHGRRHLTKTGLLLRQLESPLLLILLFAAVASAISGEWVDAVIVMIIVLASASVGYLREYRANAAADALAARLHTKVTVIRDGRNTSVPMETIVPGDVVLLQAGSLVAGDGIILESRDLFVSEAALTGESFPAEKASGVVPESAGLQHRTNCVFLGSNVRSGTARCLMVKTGLATEYGAIARKLTPPVAATPFERGLRQFGNALIVAMLVMVLIVFAAHVVMGRPPIETLLFAVALAVGLSPELLPAIVTINLSRSAQALAHQGVLVRRLSAIENLGTIDVLCTDKTGTLTEGIIKLDGAYDIEGRPSSEVLQLASINAALESGIGSPLDDAILEGSGRDLTGVVKVAEIPFDFVRRRVSVAFTQEKTLRLVTKGAFHQTLECCTLLPDGSPLEQPARDALTARCTAWYAEGFRVLAVATRVLPEAATSISREQESGMTFHGFLAFSDAPKVDARQALADLARLGVRIKIITGDASLVAQHVAGRVGLDPSRALTGDDLQNLTDTALRQAANRTDLFAEVDPNQKERIIRALRTSGHVVGFLGDGVNDTPAMQAADTSLSVDDAVDVAREAADFVLLERELAVIHRGVEEGRRTFVNTMKYILTTTSANLGNMVSMAAISLFLPFLPLLPGQILLNNFLSDVPALGLADDRVDPEQVSQPSGWRLGRVAVFMVIFGLVSSVFDLLTFGLLWHLYSRIPDAFRTAWFVESLLTELAVALAVRTHRPLFQSRPGNLLLWSTLVLIPLTLAIPYLPGAHIFGFVPVAGTVSLLLVAITVGYVAVVEFLKRPFLRLAYGI